MRHTPRGFTFLEVIIVIVIIGILAAIAIPSFVTMQGRAKEASTKENMHTFQLAAEDYCVENHGAYAPTANALAALLPGAGTEFHNPFDQSTGDLNAWKDVAGYSPGIGTGSSVSGIVAYSDSATLKYVIVGRGMSGELPLRLSSGR